MHLGRHVVMTTPEGGGRRARAPGDADAPGEEAERVHVGRQRVRLELVEDLQAMLDRSEMDVGVGERTAERGGKVATLHQPRDRRQRGTLA